MALLAALCYINTLPNDFTYDDEALVVGSQRIRSLAHWREIWLTDWWQVDRLAYSDRHADRLYRPLSVFSLALNYAFGELHAFDYHLVNLLLHATISGLAWLLLRRLGARDFTALAAGMLFAVHPIHVEAVASVVGRADLLAAAAVVAGMLAYLSDARRPRWPARLVAVLCFIAALLSKESGIILAAWMLICELWLSAGSIPATNDARHNRRRRLTLFPMLLVALAGYVVVRAVVCGGRVAQVAGSGQLDNPLTEATLAERTWTPFKLLALYVQLMLWPRSLSADYSYNAIPLAGTPLDPWVAAGIALAALGAMTLVIHRAAWPRIRSAGLVSRGCAALAVLLFGGSYALFANGPKLLGTIFAERLFYLPSLPICWLLAMILTRLAGARETRGAASALRRAAPGVITAVVVALLAGRTLRRNADWRNNETLFRAAVRDYPQAARMQNAYGCALLARQRPEQALPYLERAVRLCPRAPAFYHNVSKAYAALGRWEQAETAAETAVSIQAGNHEYNELLASLRQRRGAADPTMPRRALADARAWAGQHPNDFDAQFDLGLALIHDAQPTAAIEVLRRAVSLDPRRGDARLELAVQLVQTEQFAAGVGEFNRLLEQDPDDWRAHTNVAIALAEIKQFNAALDHARTANRLAPGQLQTSINLAYVQARSGRRAEALELYRRIRAGLPPDDPRRALLDSRIADLERGRD